MMSENIHITQKAAIGSNTNQIATQNNYYGLSAEDASKLAVQLFVDNFPKLQHEAASIARQRAEELCKSIVDKLLNQGLTDYSAFADPDMQFILNKAQIEYARFGSDELCSLLSSIIANRVNYNADNYMKFVLDEAIESAKLLSEAHLNYLSLIFICKQVPFEGIDTIEDLKKHCEYICSRFPTPDNIIVSFPHLNMLNLFSLDLGSAEDVYSRRYGFDKDEIKKIVPFAMTKVPGDYSLSPVGIVLAIINIRNKTPYDLDPKLWIKTL